MSSIKVSALSAKTSPSGSEELLINDGGTSKKITIANLPDTGITDVVDDTTPQLGGDLDSNGNDIKMGDNDKVTFGDATGGDLQIYHDGSNSYIHDAATGSLILKSNNIILQSVGGENMLQIAQNDFVKLYHDNIARLATTSTGIDVTGDIICDNQIQVPTTHFTLDHTGTGSSRFRVNGSERMRITSTGSVGIGTSSPNAKLHIAAGFNPDGVTTTPAIATSGSYGGAISLFDTKESGMYTQTNGTVLKFYTGRLNGTNTAASKVVMTLKDGGKVGIGTSSPTAKLDINNSTGADLGWDSGLKIERASGQIGKIVTDAEGMKYRTFASGSAHHFRNSSNSTTMKIDSSGRVTMPNQPAFQVYFSGSHPHGAFTPTWHAGLYDIGNNVNLSTKRFVAPVDGLYHFDFWMIWSGAWTANRVIVYIGKNGSDTYSNQNYRSGLDTGLTMSCNIQLSANDYVDVDLYQDSGSTRSINANNNWSGLSGYLIG